MSKTFAVSDAVYDRLSIVARQQGLPSIEALLERWFRGETPEPRQAAVDRILARQFEMKAKYGKQPDSTDLIREDRNR
jgi:hypothetical protein